MSERGLSFPALERKSAELREDRFAARKAFEFAQPQVLTGALRPFSVEAVELGAPEALRERGIRGLQSGAYPVRNGVAMNAIKRLNVVDRIHHRVVRSDFAVRSAHC